MNISFPKIYSIKNDIKKRPVIFRSNATNTGDTFEFNSYMTVNNYGKPVSGKKIKSLTLKDDKNNEVPGYILKDYSKKNQYFVCADGETQCRMIAEEESDCIFIDELYGKNNHGKYKGAGTELIKFAAEESKKRGHDGRVELQMAGSFPFYYKNNFRVAKRYKHYLQMNAALDYMVRTGMEKNRIWSQWFSTPIVELSKDGAQALSEGRRLCNESKSHVLYSTEIVSGRDKINADVDFCDFGDEFLIQIIDKDSDLFAQAATLGGKIENGCLCLDMIRDDSCFTDVAVIKNEFAKALEIVKKIYNCE